mmetsp:Transcript_16830/g.46229  ORF Transcript_16830/g.46229 Transcript_16830/m.46229 type:complete len:86 (-) Transcript_16830:134-391(-)
MAKQATIVKAIPIKLVHIPTDMNVVRTEVRPFVCFSLKTPQRPQTLQMQLVSKQVGQYLTQGGTQQQGNAGLGASLPYDLPSQRS